MNTKIQVYEKIKLIQMLKPEFYIASAPELAPVLLGKLLCRKIKNEIIKLRITETEGYAGENDTACHAYKGRTPRTSVMYERGGRAYVYLCYGMHNLLNVVTGAKNDPQAVLIRGAGKYDGPAKLTKILEIDRNLNNKLLIKKNGLWLEDDGVKFNYKTTPRIGINYAEPKDRNRLWRFIAEC
jgi:DNA-3-methyladenine glycosylase